jgi:hypothetical protein
MSVGARLGFNVVYLPFAVTELALAVSAEALLVFIERAFYLPLYCLKGRAFPFGH